MIDKDYGVAEGYLSDCEAEVKRLRSEVERLQEVEIAGESVVNVMKRDREVAIEWLRQALSRVTRPSAASDAAAPDVGSGL